MNTKFNTIETIRTNPEITNRVASYLEACDQFEAQSVQFVTNENVISRKSAEEVSLAYDRAKHAGNEEYMVYVHAHACEAWLSKAWNMAD